MSLRPRQYQMITARRDAIQNRRDERLARQMHDIVSQKLTVIGLELSLLEMDVKRNPELQSRLERLAELVSSVSGSVREITSELRPKVLDEFGLVAALEWYAGALHDQPRLEVIPPDKDIVLSPSAAADLFAISREIITEVFQPADILQVVIEIVSSPKRLVLRYKGAGAKDGPRTVSGTDPAWLSVRERASRLGADATLKRGPQGEAIAALTIGSAALRKLMPKLTSTK